MSEQTDKIHARLAKMGVTLSATFVPQSASRNSGEERPTLNWRVTVRRAQPVHGPKSVHPRNVVIATDYMQGIGHVPGYIHAHGSRPIMTDDTIKSQERAAELGTYPLVYKTGTCWAEKIGDRKKLPAPALAEVLYCLILDGDAADATFEEWCDDHGYDSDSRKVLATYETCRDVGHKLQRMFTSAELAELRELFQDY